MKRKTREIYGKFPLITKLENGKIFHKLSHFYLKRKDYGKGKQPLPNPPAGRGKGGDQPTPDPSEEGLIINQ